MARMPDLEIFAKKHGLRIVTIADLIQYRLQTERLVRRVEHGTIALDETGTAWTRHRLRVVDRRAGSSSRSRSARSTPTEPILCRMHSGSIIGDVFASTPRDGGRNLREAIRRIEAEKRGVIVYLPPRLSPAAEIAQLTPPGERRRPTSRRRPRRQPAPRVRHRRADPRRPRPAQDPPAHEQPA